MKNLIIAVVLLASIFSGCKKEKIEPFRGTWVYSSVEFVETTNIDDSVYNTAKVWFNKHTDFAFYQKYFAFPGTKLEILEQGVLFVYVLENDDWVVQNSTKNYYLWATKNGQLALQYPFPGNKLYEESYYYQVEGAKLLLSQDIKVTKEDITAVYGSVPTELDSVKTATITYTFEKQ